MKNIFLLIIFIIVLILVVILTLQNTQEARAQFLFWNTQASLSLILFITFSLGVIAAVIGLLPVFIRLRTKMNMLKRENQILSIKENPTKGSGKVAASK